MSLEDYSHNLELCSRCSMCKFIPMDVISGFEYADICPSIARYNFHGYSGGGKLNSALALLNGKIDYTEGMLDRVFHCQMCGGCDTSCKVTRDMEVLQPLYQLRAKCVEDGEINLAHMVVIDGLKKEDNMMQKSKSERGQWAEGLGIKNITQERAKVYFHAGCRYCYDKELWPGIRKAAGVLKKVGVDFGIAAGDEICCGGRAYEFGFQGELYKYSESNMDLLKNAGVDTIVTSCSDCYYAFKVLYDAIGKKNGIQVLHITEFIEQLMEQKQLDFSNKVAKKVTYHDPCHLGRMGEPWIEWQGEEIIDLTTPILHEPAKEFRRGTNGVYEPPRDILRNIPGVELVEMWRIKEYAWCCGAGGGVLDAYPDFAGWTATERIREAQNTGAQALITACPWCNRVFKDAIEENKLDLEVYDIIELLDEAI